MRRELLTIGHSNHELGAFLELLRRHAVTAVADVRSTPWSRRFPWFARGPLARALGEAGIVYLFLGDALGARPAEASLRDAEGRADFARIAATPRFCAALERVRRTAVGERVALLCAERDPADCHRTILVCRALRRDPALRILHVRADGSLEPHAETERRLVARAGLAQGRLFDAGGDPVERAYDAAARRIAHVRPTPGPAAHPPD